MNPVEQIVGGAGLGAVAAFGWALSPLVTGWPVWALALLAVLTVVAVGGGVVGAVRAAR
jgi:hypothetical protein